jgi:cysteinyl-tRNA synthetase
VTLTLYNTLTRRKEEFRPIDPQNVRMYVCGPTVYDYAHIGNARPVIVFDVLFRLLRHIYGAGHVTYARNITDVDDKINARAAQDYPQLPLNEAIRKVTDETERQFHADIAALGVLEPTVEPRATEHIAEMRTLIETLVAKGHAYVAEGHVLFDVSSMPDYGRFARRSLEEMEAGARVDVAPYKKGPMDFVLWKPSKPGEPAWDSPAGISVKGRPGWHIECSAMADKWLWEEPRIKGLLTQAGLARPHVFDIHGGGIDLVFPHHENEIAQSRSAHGTPAMANVWMHNGFLQVEGDKMSKSLGNFVTIHEVLRQWKGRPWLGRVVRHAMLMTHYRQPIDWTQEKLIEANEELKFWALTIGDFDFRKADREPDDDVISALCDDLNTPAAIGVLREKFSLERRWNQDERMKFASTLQFLGMAEKSNVGALRAYVTGSGLPRDKAQAALMLAHDMTVYAANDDVEMLTVSADNLAKSGIAYDIDRSGHLSLSFAGGSSHTETIEDLIGKRSHARKAKNFKEADRIRDELAAIGVQLKDSKDATTGEIVTTWEVKR